MLMRLGAGVILLGLVLLPPLPALAAARPPVELARNGKWVVIWQDDSCVLAGAFGSSEQEIKLKFTRFAPGDSFSLQAYGKQLRTGVAATKMSIDFGPVEDPTELFALNGPYGQDSGFADLGSLRLDDWQFPKKDSDSNAQAPRIPAESEALVTYVDLKLEHGRRFRLATGPMSGPMRALRQCNTDLVKVWGFDPAVQASLSRPVTPTNNPGRWLSWTDYPSGMLDRGKSAVIQFRLDVDEAGTVTGCHVNQITKGEGFTAATCNQISRRARLSPALDAQGAPVKSFYTNTVRWIISQP
jgi:Gram-negative bacterial TonB protein C-terminal